MDADKEARTEKVVQALDHVNEARGAAIMAIAAFRRSQMTAEEIKRQAEKDNSDLFGDQ